MSLLFAILSNRILLIQMNHPFDINTLLHPNVIQWNYTSYMNMDNMIGGSFYLMDDLQNWPLVSEEIFDPTINILSFHTNVGFSDYYEVFDDKWSKLFRDKFNITKDNNIFTYGCVVRYLFTYDEIVTDVIKMEMEVLSLIPGQYVSVHFRSYLDAPDNAHPNAAPYLRRGVEIANNMSRNLNTSIKVYLVTDSQETKETANIQYHGIILPSHVKEVHVDKDTESVFEGFIGVIVNIEVAARGAAFVRSNSTFSDLIESIGQFSKESVYTCTNIYIK